MPNNYANTPPEEREESYPQIELPDRAADVDMSNPEHRCAVYAQADLLHYSGELPKDADRLVQIEDVTTLFCQVFGYAASTFRETDHYHLVNHPWYKGQFSWRKRDGEWHAATTCWYLSRVIKLILAIKRAPSHKQLQHFGEPEYPHPPEDDMLEDLNKQEVLDRSAQPPDDEDPDSRNPSM